MVSFRAGPHNTTTSSAGLSPDARTNLMRRRATIVAASGALRKLLAVVMVGGCVLVAILAVASLQRSPHAAAVPSGGAARDSDAVSALRFEPNVGQTDRRVRFVSRGPGYTLLITRTGAVLKLSRPARQGIRSTDGHRRASGRRWSACGSWELTRVRASPRAGAFQG